MGLMIGEGSELQINKLAQIGRRTRYEEFYELFLNSEKGDWLGAWGLWRELFELACRFGWIPKGTLLAVDVWERVDANAVVRLSGETSFAAGIKPGHFIEDWCGTYLSNDGQTFTAGDTSKVLLQR